MRVGFIGTGTMGSSMAQCILQAGHQLSVFDVRKEATAELLKGGAKWSDSQTIAAECEAVFASLPGPKQVEDVIFNKSTGILNVIKPGTVYFDTTTSSPEVFRKVASALANIGVDAMDTPVSGRPPQMTMMVGGRKEAFEKHKALLGTMAKNLFYVGDAGTACIAKLATQYLGYTYFVAAAEALLLAGKAGVNIKTLAEIIPFTAGRGNLGSFPNSIFKGNFEGTASLDIIVKDMTLACEIAHEFASPAFTGVLAKDIFERAKSKGWGDKPFYAAVQILEQMADFKLREKD
ncbi:MAG: NAD(P)-dependent oxidoreductase [Dehalococcoidia bacterium]|nr:NAD(P)-dependent oxidoreductase [Dehalococcoidia bacterium]